MNPSESRTPVQAPHTARFHQELKALIKDPDPAKTIKNIVIATALDVSESSVSQWMTGKDLCPVPHLARIVAEFAPGDDSSKNAALVRLLLLREMEQLDSNGDGWHPGALSLARSSVDSALQQMSRSQQAPKTSGRTLCDFPNSFYPLAVVSGDKREQSDSRITKADFGAVSASPAEGRWISELGLQQKMMGWKEEVQFFTDKVFVLEDVEHLRARFGKTNLLVIGSPASNHLTRRLHLAKPPTGWRRGAPIFRFNPPRSKLAEIEGFLDSLNDLNRQQLAGKQADPNTATQMKFWLHHLFIGGIVDPCYRGRWKRGFDLNPGCDFGLLSIARNPFSDTADGDKYVCIIAAGLHLFGTAHAVRFLGNLQELKSHPYGGVLRVDMDLAQRFATRFDESLASWDTSSSHGADDLKIGLKALHQAIPDDIEVSKEEVSDSLRLLEAL